MALVESEAEVSRKWSTLFIWMWLYETERSQFKNGANINLNVLNTADKFRNVFDHPYRLGRFIKAAMDKRKNKMYKA